MKYTLPMTDPTAQNVAVDGETHNRLMHLLGRASNLRAGQGLEVRSTSSGTIISIKPGQRSVLKKITGASTNIGALYTARSWTAPTAVIDPSTAGTLTDAMLGVDPGSDDCYIINVCERSSSAFWSASSSGWLTKIFPTATPYIEVVQPFASAKDGKPIFLVAVPLVNISLYCSLLQTGGSAGSRRTSEADRRSKEWSVG